MQITNETIYNRKQRMLNKPFSINTIQNYETDLKLFINYWRLKNNGSTIESWDFTLGEIEKRKTYLAQTKTPRNSIYYMVRPTLSPQTIQSKITAIKSFIKYLNLFHDEGIDYRKIETKRIKSDYIECLTESEFQIFFNFIGEYEKYKINSLRMQLLVNIGYTSGLRLSEMLNLKIEDIRKKEIRITWKWNKTRRVFFTNSSLELLNKYIEERENPIPRTWIVERPSDFVFISHNSGYDYGNPIKKNTVCEKIKKYSDELDIGKRITIHSLRHSYATRLLESWMNIREIQELLWHKDIQTTENYCHVLKSSLAKKVNQIFS